MANQNAPFGLRPVRQRNGSPWSGTLVPFYKKADYAVALYVGDPIVKNGTANLARVIQGQEFAPGTLPEVIIATAAGTTNVISGVVVGFGPDPSNLDKTYSPASTEAVVWCAVGDDVVYEVQTTNATAFAVTDVSANCQLNLSTSGDTATGRSGAMAETFATTATHQLKVLGLSNRVNNALGDYAIIDVVINMTTEAPRTAGI